MKRKFARLSSADKIEIAQLYKKDFQDRSHKVWERSKVQTYFDGSSLSSELSV